MAEISQVVKLQIDAGKANPAPPVGTALGPTGVNMQEFCQQFNDRTKDQMGNVIPVVINIYDDRTFDFVLKTPPAANLLKKAANIDTAGAMGQKEIVATLTKDQVKEIAELKMQDLNANDIEAGIKIIAGTAKNMGIKVEGLEEAGE